MKRIIVYLIITSLLIQIGCGSVSQITLPIETNRNEQELRSLNYFGEKLSSTICLIDSVEIETRWLNLRGDKIYFLTGGLDDTTSVGIYKINKIRFYDAYGGCMKGGWLGLGLTLFGTVLIEPFGSKGGHPEGAGYAIIVIGAGAMLLSTLYGIFFLGEREFSFVQNKVIQE